MNQAIHFKILQRQLNFRNPDSLLQIPEPFQFSRQEYLAAIDYLEVLKKHQISFTYPGAISYPQQFFRMKEPPLFLEYKGEPFWLKFQCIAVVGARKMHALTESWLNEHFAKYIEQEKICVVSGGAFGVDQMAHFVSIKQSVPTIVVVPSGLIKMYPPTLKDRLDRLGGHLVCYVSEFEVGQEISRHNFFARNRLIAAFGEMVLVAQADLKSGSLLTVLHALDFGRAVLTLPAHPQMLGFSGNIKLLQEGAFLISTSLDLHGIWRAENVANQMMLADA